MPREAQPRFRVETAAATLQEAPPRFRGATQTPAAVLRAARQQFRRATPTLQRAVQQQAALPATKATVTAIITVTTTTTTAIAAAEGLPAGRL